MERFVLDAFAARTCAVKTWNRFSPDIQRPEPAQDESLRDSFDGGVPFEERILAALLERWDGHYVDLRAWEQADWAVQERKALTAMENGVPVIIRPLLPLDTAGHRTGRPDLLLRGPDTDTGLPGYYPVEIKNRHVTETRTSGRESRWVVPCSGLEAPLYADAFEVSERVMKTTRDGDLIQMGHYWRMLEAAGRAPGGTPRGGLIGNDRLRGDQDPLVCWVDLDKPLVRTFSRSSETGWTERTVLERYDHEHGFRAQLAQAALDRREPPVAPIRNRECDYCHWWEVCRPLLGEDDLSVRIDKAPLDVREISALRALGIRTVTDLAGVDLEELLPKYLPEVRHRPRADRRIELAAHRARMMVNSVDLERLTTGPINIPGAAVEIDFDIETNQDDKVYLWGFLLHHTADDLDPTYVEFSSWSDLDPEQEAELAIRALTWLREQAEADEVVVYHYSDYERVQIRRIAERSDHPVFEWAKEFMGRAFCDLFVIMKDHWFGTKGLGLKVVAQLGAGFNWRDEEPGGLNSQTWFDQAIHSDDTDQRRRARQRVLDYNEDDVRATWHLRRWLREQD